MNQIGLIEISGTPVWIPIIMAVLLVAFMGGLILRFVSPRWRLGVGGWLTVIAAAIFGPLLFSLVTVRVERHAIMPQMEVVTSQPLVFYEPSLVVPPLAPMPPVPAEPAAARESIEEMWKKLTAPRINLEEAAATTSDAPTMGPSSPQELTEAARVVLSASLPGADPFTQGWLVNAAKSILGMPISNEEQAELHAAAIEAAGELQAAAKSTEAVAEAVDETTDDQVQAISVSIDKRVEIPKPDWVLNPPKLVGNVRKIVVESDPYATEEECRRELDAKMENIVLNRAIALSHASFQGNRFGSPNLEKLGLGGDYVRRELCTDEFVDTVDSSVGEMKKSYVLLEFNESQDALLVDRAKSFARREGLVDATLVGCFALGGVATLFGLLKLDTWTRGYYTKRLFLGVPAAIITVLTLFAVATK